MDASTLEVLLGNIQSFVTAAAAWAVSVLDQIVDNPILMLFVVLFPAAGYAIGYLNRLLRS